VAAVSEQMGRLAHCSNLYFNPNQAALAKWLTQHSVANKVRRLRILLSTPPTYAFISSSLPPYTLLLAPSSSSLKIFFCNVGAEANEAAFKLARKCASTRLNLTEPVILTALGSFHGRTLATISATGQV
jgi:acetylornithine aminotransferase